MLKRKAFESTISGINSCRHFSLAGVLRIRLKWHRVPFNGAQVDLENVDPKCAPREFGRDLAGELTYWNSGIGCFSTKLYAIFNWSHVDSF